jgi:hypothetical protein
LNAWIPYKEINFADETIHQYHVDTRDFGCLTKTDFYPDNVDEKQGERPFPDIHTLLKYRGRFFYTAEDVVTLLDRLFTESGGEKKWRNLVLEGDNSWRLKYIRIYRTKWGLIICNSDNRAMNKAAMSKPVKKPYPSQT